MSFQNAFSGGGGYDFSDRDQNALSGTIGGPETMFGPVDHGTFAPKTVYGSEANPISNNMPLIIVGAFALAYLFLSKRG